MAIAGRDRREEVVKKVVRCSKEPTVLSVWKSCVYGMSRRERFKVQRPKRTVCCRRGLDHYIMERST